MEPEQTTASTTQALPLAVNYQALDKVSHAPRLLWVPSIIAGAGFIVLLAIAITQTASSHQPFDMDSELPHGGLIMLFIVLVFASLGPYAWWRSKYLGAAYRQFLADNQWSEIAEPSNDIVATSMLGIGHSQKIIDAFSGNYHGMSFRAARYEYVTGSGRSQTTHYFVDLRFDLKQAFPLIVLDNKESDYFTFIDDLPRIPNSQQLQLEGNFNDKYKVSVVPGTEQEVLQVLTPDFMEELMNGALKADVELEANELYIIKHGPSSWKAADLQALFMMADVMTKNLGELADIWQASSSAGAVNEIAATALTARQRAILRPQHWVGIGTVIAIVVYLLSWLFGYAFHF